jgi:hypothetical protein
MLTRCRQNVGSDRGSVLVITALALLALLGMAAIVIDLSSWWVHKRHLQTQADSAALAGAQLVHGPACDSAAVSKEVDTYDGTTLPIGAARPSMLQNSQIGLGGGETVLGVLNSRAYPDGQGPAPGDQETNTGDPCADKAVDVKLTDKHLNYLVPLPLFAGTALGHINVHARVSIRQVAGITRVLPFAKTDPMPRTVRAVLVGATGGTRSALLSNPRQSSDPAYDPGDFDGTVQAPVPTPGNPVEVRINASGSGTVSSNTGPCPDTNTTPDLATQKCYDASGNNGLAQLQGWPDNSTPLTANSSTAAVVHGVKLTAVSACPTTAGSTFYFATASGAASCNVTVLAEVEFRPGAVLPPQNAPGGATTSSVTVSDTATGCTSTSASMTYLGNNMWQGDVCAMPRAGSTAIMLQESAVDAGTCTAKKPCVVPKNPATVQRFFTAETDPKQYGTAPAGNIDSLSVTDVTRTDPTTAACDPPPPSTLNAYSATTSTGCLHSYAIHVHFVDPLTPADPANPGPPLLLRDQGNTVSCGSNSGLYSDITGLTQTNPEVPTNSGCQYTWFRVSQPSETCPASATSGTSSSPTPCASVRLGNGTNAAGISAGLNRRIEGAQNPMQCTAPNNWPNWSNGDPRLVTLLKIFRWPDQNNTPVPVNGFGQFYITSWAINGGKANVCGDTVDSNAQDGDVYGYFVNSQVPDDNAIIGSQSCDLSSPTPCVSVLVD